jgi:hypothetical protein
LVFYHLVEQFAEKARREVKERLAEAVQAVKDGFKKAKEGANRVFQRLRRWKK